MTETQKEKAFAITVFRILEPTTVKVFEIEQVFATNELTQVEAKIDRILLEKIPTNGVQSRIRRGEQWAEIQLFDSHGEMTIIYKIIVRPITEI